MAKNDKNETALAPTLGLTLGKVTDDAAFADFVGDGFASVETVVFGDEESGKVPRYIGQLIGPGAPIDRVNPKDGTVQTQKTFAFHPLTRTKDGTIGAAMNVTHVIPASYMMAAACDRILQVAKESGKTAIVGFIYRGQVPTRSGFRVNDIATFEKYI
jgi:hypothetical protein